MKLTRTTWLDERGSSEITVSMRQGLKLALVVFALVFAFVLGANLATVASFYFTRAVNISMEVSSD